MIISYTVNDWTMTDMTYSCFMLKLCDNSTSSHLLLQHEILFTLYVFYYHTIYNWYYTQLFISIIVYYLYYIFHVISLFDRRGNITPVIIHHTIYTNTYLNLLSLDLSPSPIFLTLSNMLNTVIQYRVIVI